MAGLATVAAPHRCARVRCRSARVPMSAVVPSPFARFLRNGPIPFVIGPLRADYRGLRALARSTNREHGLLASGICTGSCLLPGPLTAMRQQSSPLRRRPVPSLRYIATNCFLSRSPASTSPCVQTIPERRNPAPLEVIFVGGLIPLKACDLALRGAAPLLRNGLARFTVVGDGPERQRLEQLTRSLGIKNAVTFTGWVSHPEVFSRLRSADVFVFPSLSENGAGVVFQALASGAVPVVVDFGGPGDIVSSRCRLQGAPDQ